MKANELMIGDWVMDITPAVIDAISNEDICTYRNEYGYVTANPSNLKPIPLTAEILKKNGFKEMLTEGFFRLELSKDYDYWCVEVSTTKGYELLHLDIEHTCDDIGQGGIDNLKIYYVHELQHALRLCGVNKEIVL